MKNRQLAYGCRPLAVIGVAAALFLQGCYIKYKDETIIGQEDTAFPGASIESGCVLEVEPGGRWYPHDYKVLFHKPGDSSAMFTRNAVALKLEVGKCYEWKLGFRDPSVEDLVKDGVDGMKNIASDTVREIAP